MHRSVINLARAPILISQCQSFEMPKSGPDIAILSEAVNNSNEIIHRRYPTSSYQVQPIRSNNKTRLATVTSLCLGASSAP